MHIKIGITGHRHLQNEHDVRLEIAQSIEYFKAKYGKVTGVSAIAYGADTIFAQEIERHNCELLIILPFSEEEYRKDFEDEKKKRDFDVLRKGHAVTVNRLSTPTTDHERNLAYRDTGERLVNECDVLFAVWDGQPAHGVGGTGDIVAYAKAKGKEVHLIRAFETKTVVSDEFERLMDKLDKKATMLKDVVFQPTYAIGLIAGLIAVIGFAVSVAFLPEPLSDKQAQVKEGLDKLEILAVLSSFTLLSLVPRIKTKFLLKRRATEYMRVLKTFKNAGLGIAPLSSVRNEENMKRDKDFKKVFEMEYTLIANVGSLVDLDNARRMLWILAQDQIVYHSRRIRKFSLYVKRMHPWFNTFKFVFVVIVIGKFIIEKWEPKLEMLLNREQLELLLHLCIFLVIVLPSVYATFEGIKYFGDWRQKIETSRRTINGLEGSQDNINMVADEQSLKSVSEDLRNILDRENAEWYMNYYNLEIEPRP